MYDKKNIFAKIIEKNIPADIVFEDDKILAFNDIAPLAPIHILVIPKGEYKDYSDFMAKASTEEIGYFFKKLYEIAKKYCGEDFRLCTNNGQKAGQSVFHFHMHILGGKILGEMVS
ncbi:MAG UNVERIFIED_CONTAM: HIT domain-containing protein [Rickettsiaceae bacterium]|jgi:diadenosine tetraphosphate (Ap4A) HIT family hydrolase